MKEHHQVDSWCVDVLAGRMPHWLFSPIGRYRVYAGGYIGKVFYMMVIANGVIITKYVIGNGIDDFLKYVDRDRKYSSRKLFTSYEEAKRAERNASVAKW